MLTEDERGPQSTEPSQAQAPTPAGAVFLSYASEDAAAAERIANVLRTAGIEVWFDKSELRGGDAWDRQIREQIHDCRLFVPVISANSERRDEGYFRREWSLAADQGTVNVWSLRAAGAGRQCAPAALDRRFRAAPQLHR